ncbi:hypothetical protein [Cesiribacter sp. SM1]|uniref:hypothetical protein n=1 Tax=Cesiribacter sp. SM1 TaxID=2861196 RepID=UPI001CD77D66|nr:hypothetical protein [Cesiribacter sp. SM1]
MLQSNERMLLEPRLARCGQRTQQPAVHPRSGQPTEWFSPELLAKKGYKGLTFDFFVQWNTVPPALTPLIWVKKILKASHSYAQLLNKLPEFLLSELGAPYLQLYTDFAQAFGMELQVLIFRDDHDWASTGSTLLLCTLENVGGEISISGSEISIGLLQDLIRMHSGGKVKIGQKGLFWGTSNLECYLSATDSLYPGDVDMLLLDERRKPAAIIEFKKHNLLSPISEQKLENYYPYPDGRKYNRLAVLQQYLARRSGEQHIPFIIIYYPTKPEATKGRIELLQGAYGELRTLAARNFELPGKRSAEEFEKVTELLQRAIAYHHQQFSH